MASTTVFSPDGKYLAQISIDGKLKLWNTLSNSLEQEFTPDFHLTTPCTCLQFWNPSRDKGSPSPKRKKRKDDEVPSYIVLGTTSGIILVYSITKGGIVFTIDSNTKVNINCLSVVGDSIYSGSDQNVLVWNLKKKQLIAQIKAGNETITSILALTNRVLTASKTIKLWKLPSWTLLRTFTGHSSDIILMQHVSLSTAGSYILTGSKADRLLNCWNLDNVEQKKTVCTYLMQDVVEFVTIHVSNEGLTSVAAANRSGALHIYQHKLNGPCQKPIKPKTSLQVVSDTSDAIKPIKIYACRFLDENNVTIGHGTDLVLAFENFKLTSNKTEVLLRQDPHSTQKPDQILKSKSPVIGNDVYYETTSIPLKRKGGIQQEIPMEQRLENLTLNQTESKVPRMDNVAQLLLQGLHSKDKNLLRTALCRKDENVIRNSIKRLPVTVFDPLIAELSLMIRSKTVTSRFGALWLKNLAQIHAGVLISNPNLVELFSEVLGSIRTRIHTQTALNRLRGKLELLVPQVATTTNGDVLEEDDEALLVFNDKGSGESESEGDDEAVDVGSDSEPDNWEEDEDRIEDEGSNDDDNSIVMIEDDD